MSHEIEPLPPEEDLPLPPAEKLNLDKVLPSIMGALAAFPEARTAVIEAVKVPDCLTPRELITRIKGVLVAYPSAFESVSEAVRTASAGGP